MTPADWDELNPLTDSTKCLICDAPGHSADDCEEGDGLDPE